MTDTEYTLLCNMHTILAQIASATNIPELKIDPTTGYLVELEYLATPITNPDYGEMYPFDSPLEESYGLDQWDPIELKETLLQFFIEKSREWKTRMRTDAISWRRRLYRLTQIKDEEWHGVLQRVGERLRLKGGTLRERRSSRTTSDGLNKGEIAYQLHPLHYSNQYSNLPLLLPYHYLWNSSSISLLAIVSNLMVDYTIVITLVAHFFLLSRFFNNIDRISSNWIWFHYISLIKYPYESILHNEFGNSRESLLLPSDGNRLLPLTPDGFGSNVGGGGGPTTCKGRLRCYPEGGRVKDGVFILLLVVTLILLPTHFPPVQLCPMVVDLALAVVVVCIVRSMVVTLVGWIPPLISSQSLMAEGCSLGWHFMKVSYSALPSCGVWFF
eukprot:Gb_14153 [translate_table: standard]